MISNSPNKNKVGQRNAFNSSSNAETILEKAILPRVSQSIGFTPVPFRKYIKQSQQQALHNGGPHNGVDKRLHNKTLVYKG